jgi:hypothetical protein
MVPTLSLRIGDFAVADAANVAVPLPEGPMAFHPGSSKAAVNRHGLTLRPFPRSRSNHDCIQRSRVGAALPCGQRRRWRRGESR